MAGFFLLSRYNASGFPKISSPTIAAETTNNSKTSAGPIRFCISPKTVSPRLKTSDTTKIYAITPPALSKLRMRIFEFVSFSIS